MEEQTPIKKFVHSCETAGHKCGNSRLCNCVCHEKDIFKQIDAENEEYERRQKERSRA
jgi:hypothetical protein